MARLSKEELEKKKKLAYTLYVENGYEQKVIADITGISEKSISGWKKEGGWAADREELKSGPEKERMKIKRLLNILLEQIEKRPAPNNVATSIEANVIAQYSAALSKLETELPFAHKSAVGKSFTLYVQSVYGQDRAIEIVDLWHEFIMSNT